MATYFLELYQGAIPDPFALLPGSSNYDPANQDLYWAVLTPPPTSGSAGSQYIEPVTGDPATVPANTHGTDTLPDTTPFNLERLAISAPKYPPYAFDVTLPDGRSIQIVPTVSGPSEDFFFAVPASLVNAAGIYVIRVSVLNAASPPSSFPGRNARLNPDLLAFSAAEFFRQPLLGVIGRATGSTGRCPTLGALEIVAGCAPGDVSFSAVLALDDGISLEEVNWDFGDGQQLVQGPGEYTVPLTASHLYASAGPFTASLTVLRAQGCQPRTLTITTPVPACPNSSGCSELQRLVRVRGDRCAPGTMTFRATITDSENVQEITWDFGDGTTQVGGLQVTHTYAAPGPHVVSVSILRAESCSPRVQTRTISVPACEGGTQPQPDNDDQPPPDNEGGGFSLCAALLAAAIVLLLAMCVAWIVAGCLAFEPISLTVAISLTVLAVVATILLIVLCAAPPGGCRWLRALLDFLNILNVIAWVLVLVLGLRGVCGAIGSFIDAGILSSIATVVYFVGRAKGCLPGAGIFRRVRQD